MNATLRFIATITLSSLIIWGCGNNHKRSEMVVDEAYTPSKTKEVADESAIYEDQHQDYIASADKSTNEARQTSQSTSSVAQDANTALNPNFIATVAALSKNDGKHQLIRTAGLRFKVKSVVQSTAFIESIILKNEGLIMTSSISNSKYGASSHAVSKDSLLVISYNELSATLSLRVPKDLLDQTLREIAPLAVEIDYRTLMAQDETFNILWNKMTEERKIRKANRLGVAIGTRSGKLNDVVNAENARDYSEEQADQMKWGNLMLQDRIDFSNIEIQLYQDKTEMRTMTVREADIASYEQGFGQKAIDSLSGGWNAICSILLFLIGIWPLVLIAVVGAIIFIRYKRSLKG